MKLRSAWLISRTCPESRRMEASPGQAMPGPRRPAADPGPCPDNTDGYSAARFERAFAGLSWPAREALVAAEEDTGINALVLAGICAHESGWGASRLAKDKCNLAGLGAYPEPSIPPEYGSIMSGGVMLLAELLAEARAGRQTLRRQSRSGHRCALCVDPAWAEKVGV